MASGKDYTGLSINQALMYTISTIFTLYSKEKEYYNHVRKLLKAKPSVDNKLPHCAKLILSKHLSKVNKNR